MRLAAELLEQAQVAQHREDQLGDEGAIVLPELVMIAKEALQRGVGGTRQAEHHLQRSDRRVQAAARGLHHGLARGIDAVDQRIESGAVLLGGADAHRQIVLLDRQPHVEAALVVGSWTFFTCSVSMSPSGGGELLASDDGVAVLGDAAAVGQVDLEVLAIRAARTRSSRRSS